MKTKHLALIIIPLIFLLFFTNVFGNIWSRELHYNFGSGTYKVILTVYGHRHTYLFIPSDIGIDKVEYEVKPDLPFSFVLPKFALSSAETKQAKLVITVYRDGQFIDTQEKKFDMEEGDWVIEVVLHGFKEGSYKIKLQLYVWVDQVWPFEDYWEQKSEYTLDIVI